MHILPLDNPADRTLGRILTLQAQAIPDAPCYLVDDRTYIVRAGDSFHFRSERPHGYRNPGPGTARVIWVSTPPTY